MMFGLGGVYVEVFENVALRLAPLTREDAEEMIWEVRGAGMLRGAGRMGVSRQWTLRWSSKRCLRFLGSSSNALR